MNSPNHRVPGGVRGFTLIEVMITVAIIAILAGIAVPSYTDYVRRGQLTEAFTLLTDYRVKLEQYYQDHRNYGAKACADSASASLKDFKGSSRITISCEFGGSNQAFTLTAQGSGGLSKGYDYTLDQAGNKGTTKYAGATSKLTCWGTRSASSCDN